MRELTVDKPAGEDERNNKRRTKKNGQEAIRDAVGFHVSNHRLIDSQYCVLTAVWALSEQLQERLISASRAHT
jgi:hypothetical protein